MYQAGFSSNVMFDLPAAAIAIYQSARPERKTSWNDFIVCCFASFVTGVTEPLEFFYVCCTSIIFYSCSNNRNNAICITVF